MNQPETKWIRCDREVAEQHRSRVLCGGLGLEGRWSEWKDGTPYKCAMNRQYQYRCTKETLFLESI